MHGTTVAKAAKPTICLCTMCLHSSSGLESILYNPFQNEAFGISEKVHLYGVASRQSTEARAIVCISIGSSPHEIKFLQPQLLRVTHCCVTAMNIVQLPFSNDYVHLSVDCQRSQATSKSIQRTSSKRCSTA